MLSKIISASTLGLDGTKVTVEVDVLRGGFPIWRIVGLPHKSIAEARERVRSAMRNSGYKLPQTKIVVNLAPANIPKRGALFDVPIAIGILASQRKIPTMTLDKTLFIGELSLDGKITKVPGVLPIILFAKTIGIKNVFIPFQNANEAKYAKHLNIFGAKHLDEIVNHLRGQQLLKPISKNTELPIFTTTYETNLQDIKDQPHAKRALEISAAGGHSVVFKGPPGNGKTMLAQALPSILPDMTEQEHIDVMKVRSVDGEYERNLESATRPFRSPHHSITKIGLIGGGQMLQPGEITRAHRGVLFLDECNEFPRTHIESLRQPLEDRSITLTRARGTAQLPASFILIISTNPCPCGYLGSKDKECICSQQSITNYSKKISGPILDRIDLHVWVPKVSHEKNSHEETRLRESNSSSSSNIRKKVQIARDIQRQRFTKASYPTKTTCNAEITPQNIEQYCQLNIECTNLLKKAAVTMSLSMRAYHKTIKIARTIADLDENKHINTAHISEALQFREGVF